MKVLRLAVEERGATPPGHEKRSYQLKNRLVGLVIQVRPLQTDVAEAQVVMLQLWQGVP